MEHIERSNFYVNIARAQSYSVLHIVLCEPNTIILIRSSDSTLILERSYRTKTERMSQE